MDVAGLLKEAVTDRDTIAHFVWGKDEFMDKTEDEMEEIVDQMEQEYQASKANYGDVEEYLEELENEGGMEMFMEGKKAARLNEGSYVEKMAPDTKELYFKYAKEIDVTDPNKIRDHKQLDDALKADPAFTKLSQQYLLKQALGWAITFAQQMER